MRTAIMTFLILSLAVMGLSSPVHAEMVTMEDARTVAENWITLIIHEEGNWGGSETAEVEEIQEFKRGERVLGYFCPVRPGGYIVISLRKELAPVKAYSATCDIDPALDEGMADVIKLGMEGVLNLIEQQLGPIKAARTEDVQNVLEIDYRPLWCKLEFNGGIFKTGLESGTIEMNYQGGTWLLSSKWHQGNPYNRWCPTPADVNDFDCKEPVCPPGCTAIAGAQLMRYWNWPPYGEGSPYGDTYDWPNMPDSATTSSPQVHIDAVAELCYEVGRGANMQYCGGILSAPCASWAPMDPSLKNALKDHFRYAGCIEKKKRNRYKTSQDWFNEIKAQLDRNRPVVYAIFNLFHLEHAHTFVVDGWQITDGIRWYHINLGWGRDGGWIEIDKFMPGSTGAGDESILMNVYPAQALGSHLSGTYLRAGFPYRYFDRDASGSSATFEAGQNLQFLPEITAACTSTTGGSIRFKGLSSQNTLLFTRGDRTKGVRIHDGAVKLNQYGSIKFD